MMANILNGAAGAGVFGLYLLLVLIYFGFIALIVVGLIYFVKFLINAPKEQKFLRMELGKLAEEVHQIRNELKAKE